MYGVLERQFRNYYEEAARRSGATGENLLKLLECRLDNVVYRMGFAATRAEARQLVSHKAIEVNGQVVTIASYQVKAGRCGRGAREGAQAAAHPERARHRPAGRPARVGRSRRQGVHAACSSPCRRATRSCRTSTRTWSSSCTRSKRPSVPCPRPSVLVCAGVLSRQGETAMQGSVTEFLKPRVVKVQPVAPRQARVVIEPFERGFGHTLGNALRRVLLSSMPGSAITEVGDRRRAARVHQHRGRAGRRGRHPAEPEAGRDPHAHARQRRAARCTRRARARSPPATSSRTTTSRSSTRIS